MWSNWLVEEERRTPLTNNSREIGECLLFMFIVVLVFLWVLLEELFMLSVALSMSKRPSEVLKCLLSMKLIVFLMRNSKSGKETIQM